MIHKFELGGMYIVLDINSGGVHIVDELTYRLLDFAAPPFAEECPPEILAQMEGFDPEHLRRFSEQIEYSTENVDILLHT